VKIRPEIAASAGRSSKSFSVFVAKKKLSVVFISGVAHQEVLASGREITPTFLNWVVPINRFTSCVAKRISGNL
jgi:hypothetical protein